MKALEYLYIMKTRNDEMGMEAININEAIEELENIQSRMCCYNCEMMDIETNTCLQNGCKDLSDWTLFVPKKEINE